MFIVSFHQEGSFLTKINTAAQRRTVFKAMATQQIALLLLLLAAAHGLSVAVSPTPIINTTCAALAQSPNVTVHVDYEFCVRALSADTASSSATDARGLAAAAASLTVANITSTELIIADLVKNLVSCLSDYKELNDMVRRGLHDIRGGRAADGGPRGGRPLRPGALDRALLNLERGGSGRRAAAGLGSSGARAAGSVREREGAAAEELCSGELVLATTNGGDEARWRSTGIWPGV